LVYQIIRSSYELHSTLLQQLQFSTHLSSNGENALRTTLKQTFRASINNAGYCLFVKPTYAPLTYVTIFLFAAEVSMELRSLQRFCSPVCKPHYIVIFYNSNTYPIVVISADMFKKCKMSCKVVKILCA